MAKELVRERLVKGMRAGVIGACVAVLGASAAWAKADLIIVEADSDVNIGGCAENQPLASGRIAVRNNGTEAAELRGGIVSRLGRSMVAVYDPEHPDMFDGAKEFTRIGRHEQQTIPFEVGKGAVKLGRYGGVSNAPDSSELDVGPLSRDVKRNIQQSLKDLGHYNGAIDGLFGSGYRRAVSAFQASINAQQTGALTVGQAKELGRKTNRTLVGGGANEITLTLYAVVDPYNLADEENESNNLVKFELTIPCKN